MKQCPKCGKEFKNLSVHLRRSAKCQDQKIDKKEIVEIVNTVLNVPAVEQITTEQVNVVKSTLGDELKQPEEDLKTEIVFKEGLNEWKNKLEVELVGLKKFQRINIILDHPVAHEFIEYGAGDYRYPSDQFLCIVNTYCGITKVETTSDGKEVYTVIKKEI